MNMRDKERERAKRRDATDKVADMLTRYTTTAGYHSQVT